MHGRRVLLVEAADHVGGAMRTEELTLPGFRHDVGATVLPLALASRAFREIELEVEWAHPPVPAAHPLDGAEAALVYRDVDRTASGFGRDGRAWRALIGATARAGYPLVDTLMSPLGLPRAPFAAARYGISGVLPATALARAAFRTDGARAAFAGMSAHSMLSLRQPITAGYGMLLAALAHSVGWPVVRGGSQGLADALAARLLPRVGDAGTVHLGGSLDEVAAGERAVANGEHPARPFVLCVQPTAADPSRAPQGKHVLWAYCHVPNGSSVDMTAAIEGQLERFAPGFAERVLARHVMPPKALEAFDANLVGGDIGAGAADLRQFIARPVLSRRPWATPVPGLFLCSSSTPPGAGVHGMGGWQAARLA